MVSVIHLVKELILKNSLEKLYDDAERGIRELFWIYFYASGRGHLNIVAKAIQHETRTDLTGDASSILYSTMSAGEDTKAGATECERKNV